MTGHWLMLYHTFQNGCLWPGDWIDDTPQQKFTDFADSCPSNPLDFSDSCPLSPGLDPMGKWLDLRQCYRIHIPHGLVSLVHRQHYELQPMY